MFKKLLVVTLILLPVLLSVTPAFAQAEEAAASKGTSPVSFFTAIVLGATICMALASGIAIWGQSRAIVTAIKSIARQPESAKDIQTNLIIGLALIESLAIYVLLVALIIFFVRPFADIVGAM